MPVAWGLDIGRRVIKACRLRALKEGLELDAVATVQLPDATDDAAVDDVQRRAVESLVAQHGLVEPVLVAIPGHTTFSKVIRVQAPDRQKLASNMRFEAQHNIPFPLTDVVWDYHVLGQAGGEFEVSVYAAKRDQVARLVHRLADAGLDVAGVQIAPLALCNFVRYDLDLRGANLLLDVGSDNTDLIVSDGDRTWIRNMPIAGNTVTEALQEQFKVSFADAEQLKIKAAESRDAKKILQVMQPVMDELTAEVKRSVDYYVKSVPDTKFEKLLLLGNGMRLVGLRESIAAAVETPVVKLVRLSRLQYGPQLEMDRVREQLPGLGVALGLAMQGCGQAAIPVNLLPPEAGVERVLARKRPWYAGAAVVVLAAVGGLWWYANEGRAAVEQALNDAKAVTSRHAQASDQRGRLTEVGALAAAIAATGRLGDARRPWLPLWHALASVTPAANAEADAPDAPKDGRRIWLLDVEWKWKGPSPSAAVPADGFPAAAPAAAIAWSVKGAVLLRKRKDQEANVAQQEADSRAFVEGTVMRALRAPELGGTPTLARGALSYDLNPESEAVPEGKEPRFYRFHVVGEVPVRVGADAPAAAGRPR